jgi:hypothetical protein
MSNANNFFEFEADFVDSLRCIPMQVRLKLDTCGIKLKLSQWNRFSTQARAALVNLACETDAEIQTYRDFLKQLVFQATGEAASELSIDPEPDWNNPTAIAASVQAKAQELDIELTLPQWKALTPKQRFALIKLSRSAHENHNFLPALKEFKVI